MAKPRVVFPYTEAGLGHIMPMNSIADEFEKLYGDRVEVVRSQFFTETGDEKLKKYEYRLTKAVRDFNKRPAIGYFSTFNMALFGTKVATWGSVVCVGKGATKPGIKHMEELNADMVVSTHWATNYYAVKAGNKPLTAMYCPDVWLNPLFCYDCDLTMVSMQYGYDRAIKRHKKRFNQSNLKLVPFLIRKEAYSVTGDKRALKRKLGLNEDYFTVLLAEGGYGLGKIEKMTKELLSRDLPINLIAVCGKNQNLYERIKNFKSLGKTVYKPLPLAENMLELIACADITSGKSGASLMAEPCFFGVPQLITHYANDVEKFIGEYYVNEVGSAIKQFNVKKACDLIEKFVAYPVLLQPYRQAAASRHGDYGAEKCARYLFGLLCTRFPDLKDGTELY